jgi:predicted ferric reductase
VIDVVGSGQSASMELSRASVRRDRAPWFGWADLLGPAAIGTVVVCFFMWIRNEGLASLTVFDTALGSLGLLTGLLASDLMILQVVMLARIPWVEQAWGHDLLARRHRYLGYASFWFLIAHIVLFAGQRLNRADGPFLAPMWNLFVTESWLLAATVGTLMVFLVIVTSIRVARRRLRYESWHLIHLYAYLGMGLALPHQIKDGADFHETWAQIYWWGLYIVAAGLIVVYRIGLPIWRSIYHRMRVAAVTSEGPDVVSVTVAGRRLDKLATKSGQFFIWRFLDGPGWSRGNPYTISAAPLDDQLRVTIQAAGEGSARAARLHPGTRVMIEGPYGTMTAARRRHPAMLLMAAGVGITPIRALLEDTPYGPDETTLIYRFTHDDHGIFRSEIDEIAARCGVRVLYLPGPRRADGSWLPVGPGMDQNDAEVLQTLAPDVADSDIFVCGPPAWITSVSKAARRAGASRDQIHTEDFAW